MIAYIRGKVVQINIDSLIVETRDIGYEIFFARPERVSIDQEIKLYTYHKLSEDEDSLYGFESHNDLNFFKQLLSVKGIGAKSAMNIFGQVNVQQLMEAIIANDIDFLRHISGIGPKSAAQILLDLSGKLAITENTAKSLVISSLHDSLQSLGYRSQEIAVITGQLADIEDLDEAEVLKQALQLLAKRRT
jgi:Holliday junction DNA helicase RuvA